MEPILSDHEIVNLIGTKASELVYCTEGNNILNSHLATTLF